MKFVVSIQVSEVNDSDIYNDITSSFEIEFSKCEDAISALHKLTKQASKESLKADHKISRKTK